MLPMQEMKTLPIPPIETSGVSITISTVLKNLSIIDPSLMSVLQFVTLSVIPAAITVAAGDKHDHLHR